MRILMLLLLVRCGPVQGDLPGKKSSKHNIKRVLREIEKEDVANTERQLTSA